MLKQGTAASENFKKRKARQTSREAEKQEKQKSREAEKQRSTQAEKQKSRGKQKAQKQKIITKKNKKPSDNSDSCLQHLEGVDAAADCGLRARWPVQA